MYLYMNILFLLVLCSIQSSFSLCPYYCKCLWRSSKITVDCGGVSLTNLPGNIDTATQVLNMTGSDIPTLSGNVFYDSGLTNLQRLYLRNCNIRQIHNQAFNGLINLIELDLSENKLHQIPSQSFVTISSLNSLTLNKNQIKNVPHGSFKRLHRLKKLDLSNCEIESLVFGAFAGLEKLERLNLNENKLENIEYPDEILLPSLHDLNLLDNPWKCDCHMKDLRLWLDNTLVSTATRIRCLTPERLAGLISKSVDLSEFGCMPKITPPSMLVSIPQEKDVALTCQVESDPLGEISWTFNGSSLSKAREKISITQEIINHNKLKSILSIKKADGRWNGTFACIAENIAGKTIANYTLNVSSVTLLPRILDLKLEYFVLVAVGALFIFIITVFSIALVFILLCRRKLKQSQTKERINMMPRTIKMGTSPTRKLDYGAPDIISDLSQTFYQTQNTSNSSCFSIDTMTTPVSLTSSTNAILQPILSKMPIKNLDTGLRREWHSTNYFASPFPHDNQKKYPSDFGLPQISFQEPEDTNLQVNYISKKVNLFQERDNLIRNFSLTPTVFPLSSQLKTDEKYPQPLSHEPNSLLYQEHLYTQIPSLTSGYDHQYESLPALYQLGYQRRDDQEHNVWRNRGRQEDNFQKNQSIDELVSYRDQRLNNYKKCLSLPILDDINTLDYGGETEI